MTPEELEISNCLDRVFAYCKSHKGTCEGCIFFRYVKIGPISLASCKIYYAPEIFGERQGGNDES